MGRIIEHDFGKDADEPEKVQEDKAKFDEFLNKPLLTEMLVF